MRFKLGFLTAIVVAILLSISYTSYAEDPALEKAEKLAAEKKYDDAQKILHDYIQSHPEDVDAHDMIQSYYEKAGKKDTAVTEYKHLYESKPNGLNGYLYVKLIESPVERERLSREVIEKDPKSVWGHVSLATSLLDQDRLQDGIDSAKQAVDSVDKPAQLHYIMARIYRRMKDYKSGAMEAREYNKLDPGDESQSMRFNYEWFEVENAAPEDKFALAKTFYQNHKAELDKSSGLGDASTLGELSFAYADNDQDPATAKSIAALGLKALSEAEKDDDPDLQHRIKGSLLSVQAWAEAKLSNRSMASNLLKAASKTGAASETFYFSALTCNLLGREKDALELALKSASYPPVYPRAKALASELWKKSHADDSGMEAALHKEREKFSPQRKKHVLEARVSEKFQPFEMRDPDGNVITPKELHGKIALINFWAVWCPPCREELPHWNEFYAKHKSDPDVVLLSVGDEPWETIQNYMKNHDYHFSIYRNADYWKQFDIGGIPTMVILDPTGTIRFRNMGFEEGMEYEETLQWQVNAIRKMKAGR